MCTPCIYEAKRLKKRQTEQHAVGSGPHKHSFIWGLSIGNCYPTPPPRLSQSVNPPPTNRRKRGNCHGIAIYRVFVRSFVRTLLLFLCHIKPPAAASSGTHTALRRENENGNMAMYGRLIGGRRCVGCKRRRRKKSMINVS